MAPEVLCDLPTARAAGAGAHGQICCPGRERWGILKPFYGRSREAGAEESNDASTFGNSAFG